MDILQIAVAFCAGVFGTLVGSLNAFIIFGFVLICGVMLNIVGIAAGIEMINFTGLIAFGPYFAPFITFLGGCCAAMYASKRGYIDSGKDIGMPLINTGKVDVYLVGGLFGSIGYIFSQVITGPFFGDKVDGGAFTIIIISLVCKVMFNKTLIGTLPKEDKELGGRFSPHLTNVWQGCQRKSMDKLLLGTGVGVVCAMATYWIFDFGVADYSAAYFGFAIAVVSLLYLNIGIPVTHHIACCSGYAVVAALLNNPTLSPVVCVAWGAAFAIVATFLGDGLASLFYVYGDAHIDPPGLAILVASSLAMFVFPKLGLFGSNFEVLPFIIIGLFVVYSIAEHFKLEKYKVKDTAKI